MRDPLEDLKNLGGGLDARPLPPAEVRRRGNRMRHRRNAFQAVGAAAAVAVIASSGAFVTGNLTSADSPVAPAAPASTSPTPTPTTEQAPEGGWLTTSPQGFPLDALLPEAPRESGDAMLFACSDATVLPALDKAVYDEGLGIPGPRQQDRHLYLFDSGTEARAAYESVLEAWRGCAPSPLETGAEFRFEVTVVGPDRFRVLRQAYDESGEPAPEAGPAAVYEVRLYGNALFGASIWEPTGQSPLLTSFGEEFQTAMAQIDAASCVFLLEGCGDDVTEPEEPSPTEVPEGFAVDKGLPEAGGDVPEWLWAEGADVPLSPVACAGPEDLPARPVDSLRVEVSPPDETQWRHLLVFQDGPSAAQVYALLRSSAVTCAENAGNDDAGPMKVRWSFTQSRRNGLRILAIEGGMFATGTDTRVPGRTMTRVVQVGNAVLVARADNASSAVGTDDAARGFEADVASIAEAMCVFAEEPCDGP